MQSFFLLLYRYFKNHRIVFFVLVLAGGIVSAIMASRITLEEDISKSMPGENDRINLIINNSKLTNKIILNIYLSDTTAGAQPDSLIAFTDELTDSLRNPDFTPFIDQAALKISDSVVENMMGFFYENVPIFLDEIRLSEDRQPAFA